MIFIYKLFKLCLFGLNTFYFLLGMLLLIGTACVYLNPNQLNDLIKAEYGGEYMQLLCAAVVIALLLNVVGLVGCTGILAEQCWILFVYFCLLFAIFGSQCVAAVYLYVRSVGYFDEFGERMLMTIRTKYGTSAVHSRALDYMHQTFACCGWQSPRDWLESSYVDPKLAFRTSENVITVSPVAFYKLPHSCCAVNYDLTCVLLHKFHEVGCEGTLRHYYHRLEVYVAWTLACFNLFQLTLLVLSLYLLCMVFFNKRAELARNASSTRCYRRGNEDARSVVEVLDDDEDEEEDFGDRKGGRRYDDKIFMTSFYL
jgi:hypothetical protein